MANTASNTSAGKPNVSGAIWVAPTGTTLPTDTTTALDAAFACLGYCSEDGLTNATNLESEVIKAWGGDSVLSIQTSKDDTFAFTLLEVLNIDVLKFVYGSANVTGTLATGITIQANNADVEEKAIVVDMVMRDGAAKRIVIPSAKISEVGDITYSDSEAVGYETTVQCIPDSSGNTHYEYILKS
jgi:hypothetical protein